MQLGLFFILLSFSSAQAQTLQQKIDHSVLAAYDETVRQRTDVVSVERGYLMSNSGLKEYVQIKDEKFNAEVSGKTLDSKSAFSSIKDFFDTFVLLKKKSQTSLPAEKIEKEKATRQASVRAGSTLKNILAS
ncbi:MAG: hypothetical protein H7256_16745 [Bdellovibrio sp.]|nr:hypothetical protein [Bdellovibrio sp.]